MVQESHAPATRPITVHRCTVPSENASAGNTSIRPAAAARRAGAQRRRERAYLPAGEHVVRHLAHPAGADDGDADQREEVRGEDGDDDGLDVHGAWSAGGGAILRAALGQSTSANSVACHSERSAAESRNLSGGRGSFSTLPERCFGCAQHDNSTPCLGTVQRATLSMTTSARPPQPSPPHREREQTT